MHWILPARTDLGKRRAPRAALELRAEFEELDHKLVDLLRIVRENVYHPDFLGSFSPKCVLHRWSRS